MSHDATRRVFLQGATLGTLALGSWRAWANTPPAPPPAPLPAAWPTQPAELAREMVGVSHGNAARVRELLAQWPTLARAAWDWGFGDWEDALGAASHVGNREIAELLIQHGARPTIFSAAMLGQLAVVQAFVAASPGIQKIPGPHGIPLLSHAQAGGDAAKAVVAYLEALGDADLRPAAAPLGDADRDALVGTYVFGPGDTEKIAIVVNRVGLAFERAGQSQRNLVHRGNMEFIPVGAPGVRLRFLEENDKVAHLEVHDPDLVCRARRQA